MNRILAIVLLLYPLFLYGQNTERNSGTLVIDHVNVIDATGSTPMFDMSVVITGDRITAVEQSGQVQLRADADIVDGTDKYLIPGLWDMHAHAAITAAMKDTRLPLFIANGITGIRDLFGDLEALQQWRDEIAAGTLLGPRIVASGPILDGPGSREFTVVRNAAEGRQNVMQLKQKQADFVKVYSLLSREAYFSIADEAKKQSLSFAGHVPLVIAVSEASDAGQKSIEHMTGMVLAGSTREAELLDNVRSHLTGMSDEDIANSARRYFSSVEASSIKSYSPKKAKRLFARLVDNGTWQTPTLIVLRSMAFRDDPAVNDPDDPRLQYISPRTRLWWNPKDPSVLESMSDQLSARKDLYRKQMEMVGEMQRAGVGILAGTDMGNPYCFPGSGLHDELELLVEAGLTPMQALQAATLNPARFLGKENELGTIAVGNFADLVLLDGSPLADIRNIRRIDSVIVAGRLIDRSQRQAMLAHVAELQLQKESGN